MTARPAWLAGTRTRRRWLVAAVVVVATMGCGSVIAGPDPSNDALSVYDAAWQQVDLHFPNFATTDPTSTYVTQRAALTASSNSTQLRVALCRLLSALKSYHTTLTYPGGTCGYSGPMYPSNFSVPLLAIAVPVQHTTASHKMWYGVVGGDVGYVNIPSFIGDDWGDEMDDVLDALGPVRGLIFDIRGNGGGNEDVALAIAGRLTDEERVYQYSLFRDGPAHDDFTAPIEKRLPPRGRQRFHGPVAVLTDRGDGSAAEDFIAMLRVIPTTFTVGDTTIGNSSNPLWRELPNGWQMRIPQSQQISPDGFNAEGKGYPPTILVRLTSFDVGRGVDTVIRQAVAEIHRRLL
ncbi:MAG: peptidase [Gemmatimonadetes bacterium]|jgi:carboxyl-terminal processing protease|nr:peptidase [Gemmatimonadota bacterium]